MRTVALHAQFVVQTVLMTSSNTVGLWIMRPAPAAAQARSGSSASLARRTPRGHGRAAARDAIRRARLRARGHPAGAPATSSAASLGERRARSGRGAAAAPRTRSVTLERCPPPRRDGPGERSAKPCEFRVRARSTGSPPGPRSSRLERRHRAAGGLGLTARFLDGRVPVPGTCAPCSGSRTSDIEHHVPSGSCCGRRRLMVQRRVAGIRWNLMERPVQVGEERHPQHASDRPADAADLGVQPVLVASEAAAAARCPGRRGSRRSIASWSRGAPAFSFDLGH